MALCFSLYFLMASSRGSAQGGDSQEDRGVALAFLAFVFAFAFVFVFFFFFGVTVFFFVFFFLPAAAFFFFFFLMVVFFFFFFVTAIWTPSPQVKKLLFSIQYDTGGHFFQAVGLSLPQTYASYFLYRVFQASFFVDLFPLVLGYWTMGLYAYDVYGMGNALVDIEFKVALEFLEEQGLKKGVMTLTDESFQRNIIGHLGGKALKMSCGGSAANSMAVLSSLGGKGFYSCRVGDDREGDFYYQDLLSRGLATNLSNRREAAVTGRCLVLTTPDADRTMYTFLGATEEFSIKELILDEIPRAKILYIGGYLLATENGTEAAVAAVNTARKHKTAVALTLADPTVVRLFRDHFEQTLGGGVDLIVGNANEAMALTSSSGPEEAFKSLGRWAASYGMTLGPRGAWLWDGKQREKIEIPTAKVKAVDTNGAGDAFAGGLLYGITHGKSFKESGALACSLGTKTVEQFGPRPSKDQVLKVREEWTSKIF